MVPVLMIKVVVVVVLVIASQGALRLAGRARRTNAVCGPTSALDPASVLFSHRLSPAACFRITFRPLPLPHSHVQDAWFFQFRRPTKNNVVAVKPHALAGPGSLFFTPLFSDYRCQKEGFTIQPALQAAMETMVSSPMLPQIAAHTWASAAPEQGAMETMVSSQCFLRLQHTPGPAQPRSGETAWPGRLTKAIFEPYFSDPRCQKGAFKSTIKTQLR